MLHRYVDPLKYIFVLLLFSYKFYIIAMVVEYCLFSPFHACASSSCCVLFQADEVEVVIDPKDIELTTARSGGAGGIFLAECQQGGNSY
ncbi:hypothetical protein Syun_028879 [Stephania yunnanensis]|uniref:Uncharacterized protein n=1 Tax=Stephania yunnanensis TaxID=152371 RepID=A0AAP0E4C7_9MAGN